MGENKRFFYPSSFDDLLLTKSTTIHQEKELPFEERKNTMERDALKEEKLRAEKERGQKFMETEFDFKGEDEEFNVPIVEVPDNLKFKTSNKAKTELEQVFSVVEYAKLPDNLKDLFNIKKAGKPTEDDSIEYLNFDKTTHPNLSKYSRKLKIRKTESNIMNLYDINMKSLLTSAEITKRAELLAKLYMKHHYDEDKYTKAAEEEKKAHQKRAEKGKSVQDTAKNDKAATSNSSSLADKPKEENKSNLSNLPPGAKLIISENFPPPPNIKLPSQEEVLANAKPSRPAMPFKLPFGPKS